MFSGVSDLNTKRRLRQASRTYPGGGYAYAAERYDFIIAPDEAGTFNVVIEFLDRVTGAVRGKATTRITVN